MRKIYFILLFIALTFNTSYASEVINTIDDDYSQNNNYTKLDCLQEVLKEYIEVGYYNKLMFENITLNNITMDSRMDCSGFLSAYAVNFYNRCKNKNFVTGIGKEANEIDLSSINFENDYDIKHTKYLDNIKIDTIEDLQEGDICWSGSHFIIYGGKTNNIEAPFIFYHWSGETKEDDKNYKDTNAIQYCILPCNLNYIVKENKVVGLKILPKNLNYAGIMNSRIYRKFYRLKEDL